MHLYVCAHVCAGVEDYIAMKLPMRIGVEKYMVMFVHVLLRVKRCMGRSSPMCTGVRKYIGMFVPMRTGAKTYIGMFVRKLDLGLYDLSVVFAIVDILLLLICTFRRTNGLHC